MAKKKVTIKSAESRGVRGKKAPALDRVLHSEIPVLAGQARATLRGLHMSPRKVRLLVDMIRGMRVADALTQLQFSATVAARPLKKLVESAVANATHTAAALIPETIRIARIWVDGGPMQYRYTPRAMGRATPIRRRTSHITVVLEGEIAKETGKQKNTTAEKSVEEKKEVT